MCNNLRGVIDTAGKDSVVSLTPQSPTRCDSAESMTLQCQYLFMYFFYSFFLCFKEVGSKKFWYLFFMIKTHLVTWFVVWIIFMYGFKDIARWFIYWKPNHADYVVSLTPQSKTPQCHCHCVVKFPSVIDTMDFLWQCWVRVVFLSWPLVALKGIIR